MNSVEGQIEKLDELLSEFPFDHAFLGGSVLSLLVTDPTVDALRVTKDVDILLDSTTRNEYHRAERLLEYRGFHHDMREGAPLCRWTYQDITLDVIPSHEEVLGWRSPWLAEAMEHTQQVRCGNRVVRVVSAPFFVLLKLEAFEDRGGGDFLSSTDFEDVICLFNGRDGIVDEIAQEPMVRQMLGKRFRRYLESSDLVASIEGFVRTEVNPESRMERILNDFRTLATME